MARSASPTWSPWIRSGMPVVVAMPHAVSVVDDQPRVAVSFHVKPKEIRVTTQVENEIRHSGGVSDATASEVHLTHRQATAGGLPPNV